MGSIPGHRGFGFGAEQCQQMVRENKPHSKRKYQAVKAFSPTNDNMDAGVHAQKGTLLPT